MNLSELSAMEQIGFPLLSLIIFFPAVAALLIRLVGDTAAPKLAVIVSAVQLALTVFAWWIYDPAAGGLQLTENISSLPYRLGVDGISIMFIPATALLTLLAVVYARNSVKENLPGYLMALLLCEAALIGAFAASNLILFWVFFVIELFPSYYLIKAWGSTEKRTESASNYMKFMAVAALALGVGFIAMATSLADGTSFAIADIAKQGIPASAQGPIFFALCLGFAIKAPLFPLHTWLPKVLEHGPIIGMSVFLVGIKLGAYGLIRFVIPLLPEATAQWFWLMAALGFASMVYGALVALVQTNLRRLLAYASISHLGVVTLGFFSLTSAGIEGGILQALSLGITGAGLFLIASFISARIENPDLANMGGLQSRAPLLGLSFLVIALAAVGMPGTSGFNGEHLVLLGAFEKHWLMALCVAVGPIFAAAYFLRYYQKAFLGASSGDETETMADLSSRERGILMSLVAIVLLMGLYSTPFISTMRSNAEEIATIFGATKEDHAAVVLPVETDLWSASADVNQIGATVRGKQP